MADEKISALTNNTTPAYGDMVPIVNVDGADATQYTLLGRLQDWIYVDDTWTYASANTITVPSGAASIYRAGDRIKWTQTTPKFGTIITVADTLLTIAINTDYVVTNAAISAIALSRIVDPIGFPASFNWAPSLSASGSMTYTGTSITFAKYYIIGRMLFFNVRVSGTTGGTASTTIYATVPVTPTVTSNMCFTVTCIDTAPSVGRGYVSNSASISAVRQVSGTDGNWNLTAGAVVVAQGFYEI